MNALVVAAVLLTGHVVVGYFGALANSNAGEGYLRASGLLVLPLGLPNIRSQYSGVFDADAAMMVIICLSLEWVLSVWRSRS